jgi:delta 1-pyrroline-5-carboxylate dehydrogenase
MEVVEGKHFGPLVAIVRCANLEEALNIHRRCDQHLTASVFTRDVRSGQMLADRLGATNVMINDIIMPTCHPAVGIGGRGASGVGVSRGEEGLLGLTRPLFVSSSKAGIAKMAKPLPGWQVNFLSKFVRWWYGAGQVPKMMAHRQQQASQVNGVPVMLAPNREIPVLDEAGPSKPIVHSEQAFRAKAG